MHLTIAQCFQYKSDHPELVYSSLLLSGFKRFLLFSRTEYIDANCHRSLFVTCIILCHWSRISSALYSLIQFVHVNSWKTNTTVFFPSLVRTGRPANTQSSFLPVPFRPAVICNLVDFCDPVVLSYCFHTISQSASEDKEMVRLLSYQISSCFAAVISRSHEGPGEMGKAVNIPKDDQEKMKELFKINQFNLMASDMIALNRSLPDVRLDGCVSLTG